MEIRSINGLTLFFEVAELIGSACQQSVQLISKLWKLETPKDCRVYVMTSWQSFVFHSTPWLWWIPLGITMPLWYWRVKKLWQFTGGWAQRYGSRRAVGIKPPRLLHQADKSIGERIFKREEDVNKKVEHITCQELTHDWA